MLFTLSAAIVLRKTDVPAALGAIVKVLAERG